jgi:hypothetical protein
MALKLKFDIDDFLRGSALERAQVYEDAEQNVAR